MDSSLLDFTFLPKEQLIGEKQLEALKKYGTRMAVTDFSILLGAFVQFANPLVDKYEPLFTSEGKDLKDRTGIYCSSSLYNGRESVFAITCGGVEQNYADHWQNHAGRPALSLSELGLSFPNAVWGANGILEVEYGEYPQQAVDKELSEILESEHQNQKLIATGKTYVTKMRHNEFEYDGKRYVRVLANLDQDPTTLSNGVEVKTGDAVWVEVQPIKWLVDEKDKILLSKKGIFSGITYSSQYTGDFKKSYVKMFMNTYFAKDIQTSKTMNRIVQGEVQTKQAYNFDGANAEDIVNSLLESGHITKEQLIKLYYKRVQAEMNNRKR